MEGHGEVNSRRSNTITKFMYSLFEKQSMCDLFLLCSDGQIGAHRLVLGSNSEVMSKQFDQCLQQRVQKRPLCNPNRQSFPPQQQQQQQQQQQLQHHYQTQQQQQQMNHPQQRHHHQQQQQHQQQHHQLEQQFHNHHQQQQQIPVQKNICCDPEYFERSVQELKRKIQAMGIDDDENQYDFNGHNSAPNIRGPLPNQSDYYLPQECQSLYSMPKPEQPVYCPQLTVNDHLRFFDPRTCHTQNQLCSDSRLISSRGPSSPGRMNLLQQVTHLKQLLESKRQSLCPQQPSEHDQHGHRRSHRSHHQLQRQQQFQQQPHQRRQQFSQHLCNCMNGMKVSNNNNKFKTFGLHNSNSSCNNNNDGDTNNNNSNNNINNKRISDLLNSSYSNDALKNNSNSYQNNICFVSNNNNLASNKINCYNNTNVSNSDIDTDQDEVPGALHFSMEKYSLEVVCILIHFLYTGDTSHISVDNMEFLLQLSLELQIPLLHKACVKHIISTITPCNASTYLLLVDKYDMKNIRKVVLCFMLENMVRVMQSPDFLMLPHPWMKIIMGSQEARGMIAGECNNSEDQIELMIFDTLVRWIDYDKEQRYSLAPSLMGEVVHLEALSVQQLVEVVEGVGWLFEMPGVRDILTSIYKAKLLMQKNQQSRTCQNIPSQKSFPCGVSNFDFSTIC